MQLANLHQKDIDNFYKEFDSNYLTENVEKSEIHFPTIEGGKVVSMFSIVGDSMEVTLKQGDLCYAELIYNAEDIVDDEIHFISFIEKPGFFFCKRIRRSLAFTERDFEKTPTLVLSSDNKRHKSFVRHFNKVFLIFKFTEKV